MVAMDDMDAVLCMVSIRRMEKISSHEKRTEMNNHSNVTWTVIFAVVYIIFALWLSAAVPSASWQMWVALTLVYALAVFIVWRT